jgi:GH24 family phage-related lysozyme (muramidase)
VTHDPEELRTAFDRTLEHSGPPIDTGGMMLRVKNRLRHHEGWVRHMYRDTKGYVTVGVGFQLPRSEVGFYSWRSKSTKRTVPPPAAKAEWDYVSLLPYGQNIKAAKFDEETEFELADSTIGFVLTKKLLKLHDDLRNEFNKAPPIDFDSLPEPVQEAMFDLGWNLGAGFINGDWDDLRAAHSARDWERAADESHRKSPPIAATRNTEIRDLILCAVNGP